MKTLTKNQKKNTKKTAKPSTPDRLAALKALSNSRIDAIRTALKRVKNAESRLDEICDRLDTLQARCFDGMITPIETANEISNIMEKASDAWGTLEDAQFDLSEANRITLNDFIEPANS
jgi:DNA repair exonuclease SbcCD ATPase subunit